MTKNLNQALRKFSYNMSSIEEEIDLLENFCKNNTQINFSTFQLEKQIASELCFERFKYHNPSEAVREPNKNNFVQLLKETKIVGKSFEIPVFYSYSDSYESDNFNQEDYFDDLKNKFNNYAYKTVITHDFSSLKVLQKLYKNYIKARSFFLKQNPNKSLIEEPSLQEFSEAIKNSSFFNLNNETFFNS